VILGRSGARKAYLEGRGSVIIRAKTRVEEIRKDRFAIILDEIPYQVNKARMIERSPKWCATKRSKASPTSPTNPTGSACAW
jgi:DNA gyrase subunit A